MSSGCPTLAALLAIQAETQASYRSLKAMTDPGKGIQNSTN